MSSCGTILKTTGMVRGSRVFTILANMAKTKVIAAFWGPVGIGIDGLYQSIAEMISAIGDLGISQSGVRQIALAKANGDIPHSVADISKARQLLGSFPDFSARDGLAAARWHFEHLK